MEKRLSAGAAIGTWALLFGATLIAYLPALQGGLLWDGRLPDAIGEYEAALRANPAYAEAHYNLGLALAKAGRAP
jgi:tetratricopeptide (TPR) repeat protein